EQLERIHPLAAEIVDEQRSAVALHLQRRFADVRKGIVADFQSVHGKFAADDDCWPSYLEPTRVAGVLLEQVVVAPAERHVVGGIEELHDLALDVDRLGHPDLLAEAERDAFRERRLAVARRAVEEQTGPRIDRGS